MKDAIDIRGLLNQLKDLKFKVAAHDVKLNVDVVNKNDEQDKKIDAAIKQMNDHMSALADLYEHILMLEATACEVSCI